MKKEVNPGDTMVVLADCPSFPTDVKEWCQKMKKNLVVLKDNPGGGKRAEIRI
jgi:TusA-related sulfurtransferase